MPRILARETASTDGHVSLKAGRLLAVKLSQPPSLEKTVLDADITGS